MAKNVSDIVCRICNECEDASGESLEPVHSFPNVVADIRETLGIEILIGPDTPTYVCKECITSLENAQKFRQKCIRSNEFYALISELSKETNDISRETKSFDSNLPEWEPKTPTSLECAIDDLKHQVRTPCDEKESKEDVNVATKDRVIKEQEEEESSKSTSDPDSTSDGRQEKSPKKSNPFGSGRKPKKEKSAAPIICDICGNVFKSKHVFALHSRRHSNNKPYDCELCSSRFYTNSELKRHMRRHTGEKPYECPHCHRKFSDYGTLTKHIRTHTNDRPFACNQCEKSFSCTFVLKNHMLTHTGERAFRCEVCDKSFGRMHNLTTHMKSIYHQRNICIKSSKTEDV